MMQRFNLKKETRAPRARRKTFEVVYRWVGKRREGLEQDERPFPWGHGDIAGAEMSSLRIKK